MITSENITIEQIVAAKNATVRATMSGESTAEIKKLSDACAVAMGTWESDSRTAARQIVADWINAQPVTAETVTDEQILAERKAEVYGLRRPIVLQEQEAALSTDGGVIGPYGHHAVRITQSEARARVADAINARAKGGR